MLKKKLKISDKVQKAVWNLINSVVDEKISLEEGNITDPRIMSNKINVIKDNSLDTSSTSTLKKSILLKKSREQSLNINIAFTFKTA